MVRKIARGWMLLLACLSIGTAHADWLSDHAAANGSYASASDIASPEQGTAEAARTLRLLGRGTEAAAADAFVIATPYEGTEMLSRRLLASNASGGADNTLTARLLTHQNPDGGFGELAGFDSNALDTAFALEALSNGGANNTSIVRAAGYLLQRQSASGAWPGADGDADIYSTALAARALFTQRQSLSGIDAATSAGIRFLLSARSANGLWSEDFLSAESLLTIATASPDLVPVRQGAAALRGAQRGDGSWSQDVFSTALALRALKVADARGSAPALDGGSITGYVRRAGSDEPLAGVVIEVAGSSLAVLTNADGYFTLGGVPAGNQTLLASKTGFDSASAVAQVRAGQNSDVGTVLLVQSAQSAVVRGVVFDAVSQQPLANVTVSLVGIANYTATSGADGAFEFTGITSGSFSVSFHKSGYYDLTGNLTAPGGSLTALRQGLTLQGAALDDSPVTLTGAIVDAVSGNLIGGAKLHLGGGNPVSSDANGRFALPNVARGSYQLTVNASGYEGRVYSFTLAPGASGELGPLPLFAANGSTAPTTLTVLGTVVDAVDNHALGGATVTVGQTGQVVTSDSEGRFRLNDLAGLSFDLTIAAANHTARSFSGTASGFGEVAGSFALPPDVAGGGDTTSTLHGAVVDSFTHQPIPGAQLSVPGTSLTAVSAADGSFSIAGIQPLTFSLSANALRYGPRSYSLDLTRHAAYQITVELTLAPASTSDRLQILGFEPRTGISGANQTQLFSTRIANLTSDVQTVILLADVFDAAGVRVATVSPYAPGTTVPTAQQSFAPDEMRELDIPWNTAQFAPGGYRLALRIVEPGTVSRDLPSGVVIASAETLGQVSPTSAILGQVAFDPPLTQAGSATPITLSALVINRGNVPLTGTGFTLTVTSASGDTLTSAHAVAGMIKVGDNSLLDFGRWIPTTSGNLTVTVRADDPGTQGELSGTLYVGDKASGLFTVNHPVVPLGNQVVHARIAMQGVDVRTGTSTDPLFLAVKEAVRKGGLFVGPAARQWNETNRCLGCHIQSQSLTGMAAAVDKAEISAADVRFLYNDIVGSLRADGALLPSHTEVPQTQTTLHIWALSGWADARQVFRTLYRGAAYQLSRIATNGDRSYWWADHCSVWLCNNEGQTMTSVKGLAAVLRMAQQLGDTPADDYQFQDTGVDFGVRDMLGVQKGPDGAIWYLDSPGQLYARDMATGAGRLVADNLGAPPIGLAFTPDGTAYVTAPGFITKIARDGTRKIIAPPGAQSLWDIALGPDGALYVTDNNRIWRIDANDQATPFVTGGLLNRPLGMAFDADGNLFVSNYNAWNIVKVTPAGQMSVFTDGLPFQPTWLKRAGDGYLYAMAQVYNNSGRLPAGLFRIDTRGYIERLPLFDAPNQYGYNALAIIDGEVYVNNGNDHHLYKMRIVPQDVSQLPAMRAALAGAARFTLDQYRDNGPWNDIHAMRLTTLAEARTVIDDPALLAQIDGAIAYIDTLLRSRQRSDGGWSYINGGAVSDPYATAAVGLGLEYTNPSVSDPAIRKSISYLLGAQLPDGSWPFSGSVFTTKLGPTSFVMAYMPKALERLGGIDADLKLTLPANVQLSHAVPTPSAQSNAADGTSSYTWTQQGITASGRNVDFDLSLSDMTYREERAVATDAHLEFANSFSGEKLQASIEVPRVRAVSDLGLALSVGSPSYPANTDVPVTSVVNNVSPVVSGGRVQVYIRSADGAVVADLGSTSFDALAAGASSSYPATWNTGVLLPGGYQAYAQLYNGAGALVDERTAPFNIVAPTIAVSASITPDKGDYQAWDTVQLTNRVRNISANAPLAAGNATLTVRTPSGAVLYTHDFAVASLAPSALTDLPATVTLTDAVTGNYAAELVVRDAFSGVVLATAAGSFHVTRDDLRAITGTVVAASRRVAAGEGNLCTDTVRNLSTLAMSGVTLTQSLVNLDTQAVVQSADTPLDLSQKQQRVFLRNVATTSLATGSYACVLSATWNGRSQPLGSAAFDVVQPPIRIDANLTLGSRGRLLVMVDDADDFPCSKLRDIELWAPFHSRLPSDARIDVELQDAEGKRVDSETVQLAQFRGTVNARHGNGIDLLVTGASRDVITLQITASAGLGSGYTVVATATAASVAPIVVRSNVMGESCGWHAGEGAHFGDFKCSGGHRHTGGGLPASVPTDPSLSSQRVFLEKLLKDAG